MKSDGWGQRKSAKHEQALLPLLERLLPILTQSSLRHMQETVMPLTQWEDDGGSVAEMPDNRFQDHLESLRATAQQLGSIHQN